MSDKPREFTEAEEQIPEYSIAQYERLKAKADKLAEEIEKHFADFNYCIDRKALVEYRGEK